MVIELDEKQKSQMTSADFNIINWINTNEEKIPDYSISKIAEESFTSPASVSRTIRKCGYAGIAELKYKISANLNYVKEEKIVNQIFERTLSECQKTIELMDVNMILRIVRYIKFSKKIYLVALGTTTLVARDFELQLQLLGYNAYVLSDAVILRQSEKIFKKDDLIIIFSMKNSTPELEIAAKNAKQKCAVVVTCCCTPGTSLEKYSDISVFGASKKNWVIEKFKIMSRLPLHIISRTLIDYLML